MNKARIAVLAIAISAGVMALYLARSADTPTTDAVVVAEAPGVEVLVARTPIKLGKAVAPGDLAWETWPASTSGANVIRRSDRPEAITQLSGMLARGAFIEGEPIREVKLVEAKGSGFLAAVLATGMRAVSTEISAETGAGGFILPNDRVDVILTKRDSSSSDPNGAETILRNIRVLAIDQAPREKEGENAVVGKTATLEVSPGQAEMLAQARQAGTLSLALRALVDATQSTADDDVPNRNSVSIIRFGVPSTSIQK